MNKVIIFISFLTLVSCSLLSPQNDSKLERGQTEGVDFDAIQKEVEKIMEKTRNRNAFKMGECSWETRYAIQSY